MPGVTEVLSIFADYARVPRHVLEAKRILGRAVHRCIELYEAEQLDPDSVDDAVMPYLEGWIRLRNDMPGYVFAAEEIIYHRKYGFAGRLDINYALKRDDSLWQWDVKCVDTMSDATALQTSAYQEAWNDGHPDQKITKRAGVQLRPDGTYRFHVYKERSDFGVFLNALNLKRWMMNHR